MSEKEKNKKKMNGNISAVKVRQVDGHSNGLTFSIVPVFPPAMINGKQVVMYRKVYLSKEVKTIVIGNEHYVKRMRIGTYRPSLDKQLSLKVKDGILVVRTRKNKKTGVLRTKVYRIRFKLNKKVSDVFTNSFFVHNRFKEKKIVFVVKEPSICVKFGKLQYKGSKNDDGKSLSMWKTSNVSDFITIGVTHINKITEEVSFTFCFSKSFKEMCEKRRNMICKVNCVLYFVFPKNVKGSKNKKVPFTLTFRCDRKQKQFVVTTQKEMYVEVEKDGSLTGQTESLWYGNMTDLV